MSNSIIYFNGDLDFPKLLLDYDLIYYTSLMPIIYIKKIDELMTHNNFILDSLDGNIRIYTNKDKTIKYYTNTFFPEHSNDKLKKDLLDIETIYIANFIPHHIILLMMPNLKNIIYKPIKNDYSIYGEYSIINYLKNNTGNYNLYKI